jgi:hypothetical protein
MNKKLCVLLLLLLPSLLAIAQESKKRNRYVNFSYVSTKLSQDGAPDLNSKFGVALTRGHTYYLNKKPIANCIYFGIEATWIDLTYTNYKNDKLITDNSDKKDIHEGEVSMQVGPSITVNPTGALNIQGYFKFAPSFSGIYDNDKFNGNYASFFVGGGVISYGMIGIGIESRFGNSKYKTLYSKNDDNDNSTSGKIKTTFSGLRAYLSIRF